MKTISQKALVVAAHSDDETLGCGGTIARLTSQGWDVGVIFMTNGVGARLESTEAQAHQRSNAAKDAVAKLGAKVLISYDFPDNAMDSVPLIKLVQAIESGSCDFVPKVVLTHHAHDLNVDHRMVHQAVLTAFRPLPSCSVEAILCFEVPSSTAWSSAALPAFQPTFNIDITNTFHAKIDAMKCYEMEMRNPPHPRSAQMVKVLAQYRGSICGLAMAEAFEVQRITLTSTRFSLPDI